METLKALVPVLNEESGRVAMPGRSFRVSDAYAASDLVARGLAAKTAKPEPARKRSPARKKEG